MRIASGIVHPRFIRVVVNILLVYIEGVALIGVQMRRIAVRIILHLGCIGVYVRVRNRAGVDLALPLRVVLLTVVEEGSDSFCNRWVYFVLDVGLDVGNYVLKRKPFFLGQVLHDWVELEYVAGHVNLDGDVNALEEIVAEGEEVLEGGHLPRPAVPKNHLKPLYLCLQLRDVPVCLHYLVTVVLYLPHHLNQDLQTLSLDNFLPD